jgi:hypothetical protein
MAVMLAKLPTRPFAGMTQIRFKGFGLRHLSPHGTPLGSAMLYDIHLLNTITAPSGGAKAAFCDGQLFLSKNTRKTGHCALVRVLRLRYIFLIPL